jgi:hypothetical protein
LDCATNGLELNPLIRNPNDVQMTLYHFEKFNISKSDDKIMILFGDVENYVASGVRRVEKPL